MFSSATLCGAYKYMQLNSYNAHEYSDRSLRLYENKYADNTRTPSGLSHALEINVYMSSILNKIFFNIVL